MTAAAAFPGLFFCLAALVLLIMVTVSVPIWDSISFLDATVDGQRIGFGVFGYTGSNVRLGYQIDPQILGISSGSTTSFLVRPLTFALILHPIAALFALIAVIFGLCGLAASRIGTIIMTLSSALALLLTLVIFIIDMVLFGIARNRIRSEEGSSSAAQYGNANWMVLGALVALILGFCSAFCGSFGRYSKKRTERY